MRRPQRAVKAAKAGITKARELELPAKGPDEGVDHEYHKQVGRIERVVEDDTKVSLELRAAVAKLIRTVGVMSKAFVALFVVCIIVVAVGYDRISDQADSIAEQADKQGRIATENRRLVLENAETQRLAAIAVKRAAVEARRVIRQTCREQNRDRGILRTIILRNEATIPKLVAEGTLTAAQAGRALADSRQARLDLHDSDCVARAARIPIPEAVP